MAPLPSLKAPNDALFRRRLGTGDASRANPDLVLLVTLLLGMLILALLALLALSGRADERCPFERERYHDRQDAGRERRPSTMWTWSIVSSCVFGLDGASVICSEIAGTNLELSTARKLSQLHEFCS
jgi:hypothetical protein